MGQRSKSKSLEVIAEGIDQDTKGQVVLTSDFEVYKVISSKAQIQPFSYSPLSKPLFFEITGTSYMEVNWYNDKGKRVFRYTGNLA